MAVTPNFGWPTPDDTAFVRDGAAAIRALGDAVDGTVDGIDGRLGTVEKGYVLAGTREYSSSGFFEKADPFDDGNPQGLVVRALRVRCIGAGGAGGGTEATAVSPGEQAAASGGSGGSYAESFITDIAGLPSSVTVTRGDRGLGVVDDDGGSGGESSFGDLVTAPGGAGGRRGRATTELRITEGPGGSAPPSGDITVRGGSGAPGIVVRIDTTSGTSQVAGAGGPGPFGGGAQGTSEGDGEGATVGTFGAGGGGAASRRNRPARPGGNAGSGAVFVDVFI